MRSDDSSGKKLLLADEFFAQPEAVWLTATSLPKQPLAYWEVRESPLEKIPLTDSTLPIIFGKACANGSYLLQDEFGVMIGIDIAGSAFFMLTRYEEVVIQTRDRHQRFPASASLAYQEGFLDRPIINEYVEILWWGIQQLWPDLPRKARLFQVMLSHDVDWPLGIVYAPLSKLLKNAVGDVLYRKSFSLLTRRIQSCIAVYKGDTDADLNNTFDWIMDVSERLNLKSAFYFISGHSGGEIDGNYELDDPWIIKLLQNIHLRGHEIGLHPSYQTFRDPTQMQREFNHLRNVADKAGIRQQTYGGRQHYLRWEAPTTWQILDDVGLAYDSTLSYADYAGFRTGVCYDYSVFNVRTRKALSLIERPLIVMEGTLLEKSYMNFSRETGTDFMQKLKRHCQLFQGNFTLLWHNNLLIHPRDAEMYLSVLQK